MTNIAKTNKSMVLTIRTKVLTRDKYKCRSCGASENLEIHHIETDVDDIHALDNLITLCRICHRRLPHKDENRKPRSEPMVRIHDDVFERLHDIPAEIGESMSDVIGRLLNIYEDYIKLLKDYQELKRKYQDLVDTHEGIDI
jgi:predicted CopG family antitoxin